MRNVANEIFECLVYTPLHLEHAGLTIAAARAGAVPILDLEFAKEEDWPQVQANYHNFKTSIREDTRFGVRVTPGQLGKCLDDLITKTHCRIWVVLHHWAVDELGSALDRLEAYGVRVLLELNASAQMQEAEGFLSRVDALVGKGNECGGWVGSESSYLLAQKLVASQGLPVYVRGGVGEHSAAACRVLGAAGVVVEDSIWLFPESPLKQCLEPSLRRLDVKDSIVLGAELGLGYRVLYRPDFPAAKGLMDLARDMERSAEELDRDELKLRWIEAVHEQAGYGRPETKVLPLGPSTVYSSEYAQRFGTLARFLQHILNDSQNSVKLSVQQAALASSSSLAKDHGTLYPIVQGPMTRVSDRAEFAVEVARAGGLPMLALALMRAEQVEALLTETRDLIDGASWGVGLLGFAPKALLDAQLEKVIEAKPDFALLAGGRPTQAQMLESEGIKTYIHAPVPSLLESFLDQGARRFVLEGRECGGHVGPLSSFVLWEQAIAVLVRYMDTRGAEPVSVLFAGGIHDRRSAAMVAAMAAPLVERGGRIGVLMGTPYIFSKEAVATGAIVPKFQEQALDCKFTEVIETSPGHQIRCSNTAFIEEFSSLRRDLIQRETPATGMKDALESLSLGRLRIASKGIARSEAGELQAVDPNAQLKDGMYMLGETATMHHDAYSLHALHEEVTMGSLDWLKCSQTTSKSEEASEARPSKIAIVGMSAFLPGAENIDQYWRNLLDLKDVMVEVPKDYWDWRLYYQDFKPGDQRNLDKTVSKWGGFIDEVEFNPIKYGIPPRSLKRISPAQLLALESVGRAVTDAGYSFDQMDRENTSVIFGTDGSSSLKGQYMFRTLLPMFHYLSDSILERLPEWGDEAFPGILANVTPGRVANRFDFGGTNFVVDAACASSLKAIDLAVQELESGRSNCVIAGGVDIDQTPEAYVAFSSSHALSPTGRVRTFDKSADGIVISEGISVVMLKRLEDAERDGDRIYSVIQGVGSSSDGKALGLTAPNTSGQQRAFKRAYNQSGVDPKTLGYYEAHGTGTVVGDRTELQSFHSMLTDAGAKPQSCAVGSHKTLIGHTKTAAGITGLIKASMSLYHRVLPPHAGVESPIEGLDCREDPLFMVNRPSPWCRNGAKRSSGVSAFGFGGTNTHVVLEEYDGSVHQSDAGATEWPNELCLFKAKDEQSLIQELGMYVRLLERGIDSLRLSDFAYTLSCEAERKPNFVVSLGIVSASLSELIDDLKRVISTLGQSNQAPRFPARIVYSASSVSSGKVAFVFPGQGAQYLNMARECALYFNEIRDVLEDANHILEQQYPKALSQYVFSPAAFSEVDRDIQKESLTDTHVAQAAIGAVSLGFYRFMQRLGISPDVVCGHSYGEFTALHVAGAYSFEDFLKLSEIRGRNMASASELGGKMLVVFECREKIVNLMNALEGTLCISNHNAPKQVVLSGSGEAIEEIIECLDREEIRYRRLNVAGPFHSKLMEPAKAPLAEAIEAVEWSVPKTPVYSNMNGACYPESIDAIKEQLGDHLLHSVEFVAQVEQMSADGVDVFVECGPNHLFTKLIDQILEKQSHLAVALDRDEGVMSQVLGSLARLFIAGVMRSPSQLFAGREVALLDLSELRRNLTMPSVDLSGNLWYVDGSGCRAASEKYKHSGKVSPLTFEESVLLMENYQRSESTPSAMNGGSSHHVSGDSLPTSNGTESYITNNNGHKVPHTSEALAAYESYQKTMRQFLKMEEDIMTRFLGGGVVPQTQGNGTIHVDELKQGMATVSVASNNGSIDSVGVAKSREPKVDLTEVKVPVEVGTAAEPVSVEKVATTDLPSRAVLQERLLALVSELTGYPEDLLEMDSDLESELGVDSIKRIEILTKVMDILPVEVKGKLNEQFENLTQIKTLTGIVEKVSEHLEADLKDDDNGLGDHVGLVESESDPLENVGGQNGSASCPLSIMVRRREPLAEEDRASSLGAGLYVVTEGPVSLVAAVKRSLKERGASVAIINHDQCGSAELLEARIAALREQMPIAGIIHLAGVSDRGWPESVDELKVQTRLDTKSFFQLIQLCREDLLESAQAGGGQVVSVSHLDGLFGRGGQQMAGFPSSGSGVGLLKTLATEWSGLRVRALDFDANYEVAEIASKIVAEVLTPGDSIELGYHEGVRYSFGAELVEAVSPESWKQPEFESRKGWVVLATGGARGITAEILKKYAEPGMKIVLVGRSPISEELIFDGSEAEDPDELKRALITSMRVNSAKVTPSEVEVKLRLILGSRERKRTIQELESLGAEVAYHAVDVSNEASLKPFLDEIYARFGRIDAVFHGAGVLEDKLIVDKTLTSFDRVFDVKVDSTFLLKRHLRSEGLREFVLFASIAGRFGNRGQVDYAAANEVLNRYAWTLNQVWESTRVVSINWGPWASVGMAVDARVAAQFKAQGILPISTHAGTQVLMDILNGVIATSSVEIVAGSGDWIEGPLLVS